MDDLNCLRRPISFDNRLRDMSVVRGDDMNIYVSFMQDGEYKYPTWIETLIGSKTQELVMTIREEFTGIQVYKSTKIIPRNPEQEINFYLSGERTGEWTPYGGYRYDIEYHSYSGTEGDHDYDDIYTIVLGRINVMQDVTWYSNRENTSW